LQGIPLYLGDKCVATTFPNSDFSWLLIAIKSVEWDTRYEERFGSVAMIIPETSCGYICPSSLRGIFQGM